MAARTMLLVSAGVAAASGLGVMALGGASLAGRRTRPRGAFAFGLFAIVWGAQILLANLGTVVLDAAMARRFLLLSLAFLVPAPYFLAELASDQDPLPRDALPWRAARVTAAGFGVAAAAALVLAPDRIILGFSDVGYAQYARWGVLRTVLVDLPFTAAFGLALVAFQRAKRASPTPRTKRRAGILLAGLGLYLAFNVGNNLPFFLSDLPDALEAETVAFTVLYLALAALVLRVGLAELRNARRAATPAEARRDRRVAAAMLLPFAWGLAEGWFALAYVPTLYTVGVWRLAGMGVIAYGFARWRVFDLPERTRRGVAVGAGATAAGLGGATVYAGAGALLSGVLAPPLLGLAAAAASLPASVRASRRLLGPGPDARRDERVYEKRVDSYRAAVESAMARGLDDEDESFLEGLRDRYDITPEEDRVIRYYARNAVVGVDDGADETTYERLRLLGEGGEGRTWLARDRARERLVVLKEPLAGPLQDPALEKQVLEEARAARKVQHPNVVEVEEVVEAGDSPVLVMEHVEGGSLADLLEARGPVGWPRARGILLDVLAGLEAVHRSGLVHRDVKPSNVLLDADGTAKVADFGVATRRPGAAGGDTLRDPGAPVGTRGYVAPEVAGGGAAGEAADVYGAGALLHALLTGRPPEEGEPALEAADLPAGVADVQARALAPEPGRRWPSASAMREAVAGLPEDP